MKPAGLAAPRQLPHSCNKRLWAVLFAIAHHLYTGGLVGSGRRMCGLRFHRKCRVGRLETACSRGRLFVKNGGDKSYIRSPPILIDSSIRYPFYVILGGEYDSNTLRVVSWSLADQNSTFEFSMKKRDYFANNLRWELDRTIRNTSSGRGNISLSKRFSPNLNRAWTATYIWILIISAENSCDYIVCLPIKFRRIRFPTLSAI